MKSIPVLVFHRHWFFGHQREILEMILVHQPVQNMISLVFPSALSFLLWNEFHSSPGPQPLTWCIPFQYWHRPVIKSGKWIYKTYVVQKLPQLYIIFFNSQNELKLTFSPILNVVGSRQSIALLTWFIPGFVYKSRSCWKRKTKRAFSTIGSWTHGVITAIVTS